MKKFLKNASIYILFMVLIAGLIFSLNYFYGQKIAEDISTEINQFARDNGYELNFVEVEANPLLKKLKLKNLNLTKDENFNLILNEAVVNFSWQQILNYIQNEKFEIDKNLDSEIAQINYSNLSQNYQLKLSQSELNYQGEFPDNSIGELKNLNDLAVFLEDDHKLDFKAEKFKFDFPYYRRYGLSNQSWNQLSTFDDFILKADYLSSKKEFNLNQFNLSNDILKIIFDINAVLVSDLKAEKVEIKELLTNYDFLLAAEKLDFKENDYFKKLHFKQFDFGGDFNLKKTEKRLELRNLDFGLNLNNFELILSKELTNKINQNTFEILANQDNFSFLIEQLKYQQEYNYPNGKSRGQLDSSLLAAEMEADYNYSQEIPYINSAKLSYKSKNSKIEQLNLFIQLVIGKTFRQNEAGYYELEIWGPVDDLNFE